MIRGLQGLCTSLMLLVLFCFFCIDAAGAITVCYNCTDARTIGECTDRVFCGQYEKCYTSVSKSSPGGQMQFTLGCMPETQCSGHGASPGLVGRRFVVDTTQSTIICSECCNGSVCNNATCVNDGGWSMWDSWSACSATCNGGLQTRSRTCDNPSPSGLGKYCVGHNYDPIICNTQHCPAAVVIFSADNGFSGDMTFANEWNFGECRVGRVIFSHIVTNISNDYNKTTGQFTCSIDGVYHFDISFSSHVVNSTSACVQSEIATACVIRLNLMNDNDHIYGFTSGQSASGSAYLILVAGDVVDVYCLGTQHIFFAHFNGALVAPA